MKPLTQASQATTSSSEEDAEDVCQVAIRRVSDRDLSQIVNLFQAFDTEKYRHISPFPGPRDSPDNNNVPNCGPAGDGAGSRRGPSLAALRIDDMGGIYLTPVLDQTNAYFKCFVAEDVQHGRLVGYILFFNTLGSGPGQQPGAGPVQGHLRDEIVSVVEDLYVKDDYRGRGIATQMLRKVVKSSLDRGCFSCECLLIPESSSCLSFWRRRMGEQRVSQLLKHGVDPDRPHELFMQMSRAEMKDFYDKMAIH